MTDALEVRPTNGTAFLRALTDVGTSLDRMDGPMAAVGQAVLAAARAGSPRRSGATAGAHRLEAAGRRRVRIVVNTPYAAVVHWGWPAHGIRRQPWVVATFNRNRAWEARMGDAIQKDIDHAAART